MTTILVETVILIDIKSSRILTAALLGKEKKSRGRLWHQRMLIKARLAGIDD